MDPFEILKRSAEDMGAAVADSEREIGISGPQDSPLSGEWADGISAPALVRSLHASDYDDESQSELFEAFETAYAERWRQLLES